MNKTVRIILMVVLAGVFIFAGVKLISIMQEYKEAETIYNESREAFDVREALPEADPTPVPGPADIHGDVEFKEYFPNAETDFVSLQRTNPDVVGWIWLPSTEISYPLIQGKSNQDYLHKGYNGQHTNSGSIFMDYRNSPQLTDDNTVIFGHNMNNGSMFGSLKQFRNQDYFDAHRLIFIFTPEKTMKYRIFSGYETISTSQSYTRYFSEVTTGEEMTNEDYLAMLAKQSLTETNVEVNVGDKLITLSTCTGNGNHRFVLHAVFVAEQLIEK